MKRIKQITKGGREVILGLMAVLLVLFLASVSIHAAKAEDNGTDNGADAYASEEDEAKAQALEAEQNADEYVAPDDSTDTKKTKKKRGGLFNSNPRKQGINKFIYGNGRYIEYDEFKLYTANPVGKLVLVPAKIIINPKNGDAGVQTRFQASNYAVLFNDQMRHKIFGAVEQYLKDFEAKKLKRKDKKSYCAYGRGKIYINYGTLAMMMAAEGKPDCQIGYKFKSKSPYFAITVRSAPNIDPYKGYNDVKDSTEFILYFTKAQAQTMCSLLTDEIVQEALREELEVDGEKAPQNIGDEYTE